MSFEVEPSALQSALEIVYHTASETQELVAGSEDLPYITVLENIAAIKGVVNAAAKELGLDAVEQGCMTRKEVGNLIGVHPITISRWLTARQVEQQQ